MRYPDDLTTEDVIDIFISKGLLEEDDIDDYLINEAEDGIYLTELENQEREAQDKQDEIERQHKMKEASIKREREIKEIYPEARKIIKNNRLYNFSQFGGMVWICLAIISVFFIDTFVLWYIFFCFWFILVFGSEKYYKESHERFELAKESLAANHPKDEPGAK